MYVYSEKENNQSQRNSTFAGKHLILKKKWGAILRGSSISRFFSDLCFSHLKEMLFTSFWNFAFLGQTYQKHFFKMHHFKKMWGTFLLGRWNRNQKNRSIYISFRTGQIFAIAMNIVCLIGFSVSKRNAPSWVMIQLRFWDLYCNKLKKHCISFATQNRQSDNLYFLTSL